MCALIEIPANAEVLHQSEGLSIHRNAKNRFVVATLYYQADPAKRSDAWRDTVKAGMTQSQWEREYEISYTAMFGERVFPEIVTRKSEIVVPDKDWDGGIFWGGFDYGQRNPSSFHVYTYAEGAFVAIWELYHPCKNIPEFAMELRNCPYYSKLKYIAADPSLFAKRTHNAGGEPESVANLFIKEGIHKFIPGNTDEASWIALLRKHWEQDNPTFKIAESCRNLIREFEAATFEDYTSDKVKEINNFKEGIQDRDNHALDDNKYFFNSQPIVRKGFAAKAKMDQASKWYGWGDRPRKHRNIAPGTPPVFSGSKHPRFKEIVF